MSEASFYAAFQELEASSYWGEYARGHSVESQQVAAYMQAIGAGAAPSAPTGIQTKFGAGLVGMGVAFSPPAPPIPPTLDYFWTPTSFLRTPLGSGRVVDPNNSTMMNTLLAYPQVQQQGLFGSNGSAAMKGEWSTCVYYTSSKSVMTPFNLSVPYTGINGTSPPEYTIMMPYESRMSPPSDSDAGVCVIDLLNISGLGAGTSYDWEIFVPGGTSHSVAVYNVLTEDGSQRPGDLVGDMPSVSGMITPYDVNVAGKINHAVGLMMPVMSAQWRFPACRSDNNATNGIPSGGYMDLDPSVNLAPYNLSPFATMVAVALQTYGGFAAEGSGSFATAVESVTDGSVYNIQPDSLPYSLVQHMRVLTAAP